MLDKRTVKEYTDPFSPKQGKLLQEQAASQIAWVLEPLKKERGADLSRSSRRP